MPPVYRNVIRCRPRGLSLRIRCETNPQPNRKMGQAPDIRVPRAPPPPAPPPPPPPTEDDPKFFGISRRTLMPFFIGIPLGLLLRSYNYSQMIREEVVASVDVPVNTKNGVKKLRKDVKLVMGKNGMLYVTGTDERGRRYMVDANGTLFYDSGFKKVGWYAVDVHGEMWNLYQADGTVKVKSAGNISELKEFQVDEIMGLPIEARRWVAFDDPEVKMLPPNMPVRKSTRDESLLIPPLYIDEGEIVLEKKKWTNPFRRDGGGAFKTEPTTLD